MFLCLYGKGTAMIFRDFFTQSQPDTCSFIRVPAMKPLKYGKYLFTELRVKTNPVIAENDLEHIERAYQGAGLLDCLQSVIPGS